MASGALSERAWRDMIDTNLTGVWKTCRAALARRWSAAVLFLASDEARYITGVALPIDAGATQA